MADRTSVLVCGSDRTTLRVVSELVESGERVSVVMRSQSRHIGRMEQIAHRVVVSDEVTEDVLQAAGVGVQADDARPLWRRTATVCQALVMLDADDVRNLHVALTARGMDTDLRIVMKTANPRLGKQLGGLLGDCVVVSGPSLAAPAFVADALDEDEVSSVDIAGHRVAVGPADRVIDDDAIDLTEVTSSQASVVDPSDRIALGREVRPRWRQPNVRLAGWPVALRGIVDRRVRIIGAVMAVLVLIGTLLIHLTGDLPLSRSFYFAVGAITSAGIEDPVFVYATPMAKVVAVGGQLVGIVLVAILTAVIADALIGARLSRVLGGVRGRPRNHVIVCGLGTVGAVVLELLAERGIAVIGVEQDEDAPGVQTAHRLRVPVVIGDSSNVETLRQAGVERCRALLALTDGDITNLDTTMTTHDLNPEARITMRMFDHDLAYRVEHELKLGTSKSVSMLVAPAVAAAVSDRRPQTTVSVGRHVLLLTEVTVEPDSTAVSRPLRTLDRPAGVRVLAYKPSDGDWTWERSLNRPISVGDQLAVAATRSGVATLLLQTRAQEPSPIPES